MTVTIPDVSIGDYVWIDTNGDGQQGDPSEEPPVEGVVVNLLDDMGMVIATTNTDVNGFFEFPVQPGTYTVEFELPPGFMFTDPGQGGSDALDSNPNPLTGRTDPITVVPLQEDDTTIDAGLIQDQPAIEIIKLPDLQTVPFGATVQWDITVRNTGNVDLTNVTVTDPLAPDCDAFIGDLAQGEETTYTCTLDDVQVSFTNVASVVGTPPSGPPVTDDDDAVVDVVEEPRIEVSKRARIRGL